MRKSLFILTLIFVSKGALAQMVGSNCYLKGNLVELGINGSGGYEGVDVGISPPLPGMHHRAGGNPWFGFVANPQMNAWLTFDGDFFTPGTPENGWGFEIIDGTTNVKGSNNCQSSSGYDYAAGSITNYQALSSSCILMDWKGDYIGTGYDLDFNINYYLDINNLFYTTTVKITNNGTTTIPDFYYYRNFDPDNNVSISGDFSTTNNIVSQPTTSACQLAHVKATSAVPSSQPMSYVGIAAVGSKFRVSYGGFSNRDGSDIWNGTAGLTGTVGSTLFSDEAISLAYRIQNLAPGASETFKFVIILDDLAAANAIDNLVYFTYPGSTSTSAAYCTSSIDTVKICQGSSVSIGLTGVSTGSYTWGWSPPTGLSSTTGPTVTASPSTSTLYTVTGTPSSSCFTSVTKQIYVRVTPGPTLTVNSPSKCAGSPAVTLTASGASSYTWSPSTGLSATTGSSVTANPSSTTTYTVTGTNAAGCTNTALSIVTVNPLPTVSVPGASKCAGSPGVTLTASGASTYTWSPSTGLSATTGTSVSANPSSTTTYTISGTSSAGCTATTTAIVTVNPLPTVSVPGASKCAGSPGVTLTASGASTYTWSPSTGLSATTGTSVTANPSSTTTYTITGTSSAGCTATTTAIVTVNPLPTVSVSGASICSGASTTLTASGASTYTWSPSTGLSATTGTSVTANPSSTTTYTITGTSSAGCTATTTAIVTVNPLPTVSVSGASICNGASTTLTASGASTYTWSPSTGLSATTGTSVTANPTSTTTYTITGTNGTGCTNTTTAIVTVNPLPTVSVPGATICNGASTTLTASGASTYTWSPSIGLSATSGTSVTANPTSTTTYTITGTSAAGCINTTTAIVTVNPLPTVSVPGASICNGSSTTLTASGASTYTWSPSTGLSATTGTSVTANPTSTTTYTITGTNGTGCTNTTTAIVTVNPLPTVSVPGATICNGASTTLTASGASTYTWSPSTGLSATSGTSVTANPTSTTTYTITGTSAAGCTNTTTTIVTVNPLPTVSVPGATICNGASTTLTASGASTYTWSPSTGLSATTGTSVTANPSSTTTYTITGTSSAGCTATTTAIVTVNPLPTVSVPGATICNGASTTLTASGASTYTWSPSTGLSATSGTNVTANPTSTTTYTITGTSAAGCTNTTTAIVIVNPTPVFSIASSTNPTSCGGSDGTITITGLNPSTTYTIDYNYASGTVSLGTVTTDASGNYVITGLSSGGYSNFTVTLGVCPSTLTASVALTDPSAPVFTVASSTNPTTCSGTDGSITISGLLASTTYTFSYDNGSGTVVVGSITTTASGTYTLTGLSADAYTNFTMALAGCTGAISTTVTLVDPAAPVFALGTVTNTSTCGGSDGSILLTGLNPSTTYTITYTGPSGPVSLGTITTDASGNYLISGLSAGSYSGFNVSNSGCTTSDASTVTISDPTPPSFAIGTTVNPSSCGGADGSVQLTGLNPSTSYTISYDGPSGTVSLGVVTTDASGNYVITGLTAGSYTNITVTINACTTVGAGSASLSDPGAPVFALGTTVNPTTCSGTDGSIQITGLNPSTSYTFSYDGPSGTVSLGTITTDASGNYVITGLGAGAYTGFTLTSAGCTSSDNTIINLVDPPLPTFTVTVSSPTVCGATDGFITLSGLNPSSNYDVVYTSSTGVVSLGTITTDASGNYTITGLGAGSYSDITVTATACSSIDASTYALSDPGAPTFTVSSTNPTTCGGTDGTITVSGLTPSSAYDITYTNGSLVSLGSVTTDASGNYVITGLAAGTYTSVTVVLTGCTSVDTSTINLVDPIAPAAPVAGTDATYCEGDVMVDLNATAGFGGTLTWYSDAGLTSTLGTGATLTPSSTNGTTIYYVTETVSGCESSASLVTIVVNVCDTTELNIPTGFTPDGDGTNDTWEIQGLTKYPECQVDVFTRWGAKIFVSDKGYTEPWDGRYNGSNMPLGAYYFVIYFNDGSTEPMKGTVTIIR